MKHLNYSVDENSPSRSNALAHLRQHALASPCCRKLDQRSHHQGEEASSTSLRKRSSDLVWFDHSVRRAIWINLPGLSFLMLICAMAGLVMYARYYDCDPIMTKKVSSPDQVSPFNENTTKSQAATYSYKHSHRSTIRKAKAILCRLVIPARQPAAVKTARVERIHLLTSSSFSERQSTSVSTDICLRNIQLNRHALCVVYLYLYFPSVTAHFYTLLNCFAGIPFI